MEVIIFFGIGIHIIKILDGNYKKIATLRTSIDGTLKYKFSRNGSYSLICIDDSALSIVNMQINILPYAGRPQGISGA